MDVICIVVLEPGLAELGVKPGRLVVVELNT